jgi:TonB family protein
MRILHGLLASLFIHILFVIFLQKVPLPQNQNKGVLEFQIQESSQNETIKKQVVTQSVVPDKYKVQETEDKLRFLSDRVQRVKEQTKAAISGLTKNQAEKTKSSGQKLDPFDNGYKPRISRQNIASNSAFSTVSESLEQVKVGSMTALNTDQYLFYSFFNRVNELVYLRWSSLVRLAQDQVAHRLYNKTVHTRWLTQIDIWIKPNGEFHSAHILKESGVPEFDRAAVAAFQQAGLFPNPPKELVEEDGFIHLKYGLTVYFDPKTIVLK